MGIPKFVSFDETEAWGCLKPGAKPGAKPASSPAMLMLLLSAVRASAPADMVVPSNSGKLTVSHLLPRVTVADVRTACPWDESGLVAFPTGASHVDVTLSTNTKYLLSSGTTITGTLTVLGGAELIFADTTFELVARSILVNGRLRIGSPTCRTSASTQHTITLTGARSDADSVLSEHKGIVVYGAAAGLDLFGALQQPSWSRLAATASAGASILYVQECVEWAIGAKLVVTTTHLLDWRRHNQNEEVEVSAVACETVDYLADGMSSHDFGKVTLTAALAHAHYAARGEYQAEVGLLSRNVLVRGAAADSLATDAQPASETCSTSEFSEVPCSGYYLTGYGGHVLITGGAAARVSGAEFYRMGQANTDGRYPVHLHLLGAAGAASYISDCSVHESFHRGVVVHGTNGTLVTRNVAYDVIGHCYYMESGNEENNEVSFNLGAHVHTIGHFSGLRGQATGQTWSSAQLGGAEIPADGAASPFYISNMYNNFTGNAAVGGFSGFAMVSFPKVLRAWPPGVTADDSYVPKNRPSMTNGFYGNSARSTGSASPSTLPSPPALLTHPALVPHPNPQLLVEPRGVLLHWRRPKGHRREHGRTHVHPGACQRTPRQPTTEKRGWYRGLVHHSELEGLTLQYRRRGLERAQQMVQHGCERRRPQNSCDPPYFDPRPSSLTAALTVVPHTHIQPHTYSPSPSPGQRLGQSSIQHVWHGGLSKRQSELSHLQWRSNHPICS